MAPGFEVVSIWLHPHAGLLPQVDLVRRAAEFVLRIVSVLGLVPAASDRLSSFNVDSSGGAADAEAWRPFVDAFADFRETVRRPCEAPAWHLDVLALSSPEQQSCQEA